MPKTQYDAKLQKTRRVPRKLGEYEKKNRTENKDMYINATRKATCLNNGAALVMVDVVIVH